MESSDAAIVRRVLAGEIEAFAALVDRYGDRCSRFAHRMLGNADDADDVLQETFVRAFRSLRRYEERDQFGAWLYRILVNRCRTALARRARRDQLFVRDESLILDAESEAPRADPDDREELRRVVATLPTLLREAFLLRYAEELTYEEMAEVTGARQSALRMRVKRASDLLRSRLRQPDHA